MTSNDVSDAAVVADMIEQFPTDEALCSLTGDGTYDTQAIYEALRQRGCTPIIPRTNMQRCCLRVPQWGYCRMPTSGPKDMESAERLLPVQLGRNQDECIKRLGKRVMSRTFERQDNELHIRVAMLNQFTELGRPQRSQWHSRVWGQGHLSFKLICITAPLDPKGGPA